MGGKKNKKAKKPAVGNPAAGSNNKRAKKDFQQKKNSSQPVKNKGNKNLKKEAELKKKGNTSQKQKKIPEAEKIKKEKVDKNLKSEKIKKEKPEKAPKAEKVKIEKTKKADKPKREKKEKKRASLKSRIDEFSKNYSISRIAAVLSAVIVFAAVIIVIITAICGKNYTVPDYVRDAQFKGRMEPESSAFSMDISENQQETLAKAIKAKGDRRAFDFFVNDTVVMTESDDPALIEFGSVSSNDCVLLIFMLDEKGNEIYRSLGIEPGEQISSVSLFDELPYGTHDVTLAVLGYNTKTYRQVGMQTTKIKLKIGVD